MNILFDVCKGCRGKGKYRIERVSVNCPDCGGKGYVPTELGQHILDFVSIFCRNDYVLEDLEDEKTENPEI